MAAKQSAGVLLYRLTNKMPEVFLVHPGGPFWKNKDVAAWSIPKGEFTDEEDGLLAAKREFEEETGVTLAGKFIELKPIKQKGGKLVFAWAVEGDIHAENIRSNTFKMEWPPKSGKMQAFPEVDKAGWFKADEAKKKINASQTAFIDELLELIENSK